MLNLTPGLGAFLVVVALVIVVLVARFRARQRRSGTKDAATWHMHSDTSSTGQPDRDDPSSPDHGPGHGTSDADADGPD